MNARLDSQRPRATRTPIGEIADLAQLQNWRPGVKRTLDAGFDLGELRGRVGIVQRLDDTVVLFVLAHYASSDVADEIERMVQARGYVLGSPSRYRVPPALLLAVGRRMAQDGVGQAMRPERSALAAAFDDVLAWAVKQGASDIHFNVDRRAAHSHVRFTIDGQYVLPERYRHMPSRTVLDMLAVAWMRVRGGNGAVFDPYIEQQGRIDTQIDGQGVVLRWASLAADAGPSVCLRILLTDPRLAAPDLSALGFIAEHVALVEQACQAESGALVVAGTVGSGKSTTLACALSAVASHRKLISLEDPVEYPIAHAIQNTVSRALGDEDDHVFDAKLRTIKRSGMDDLLIGELRDRQTGLAFTDLAASGVRLYATTHTSSVVLIPERLGSDFIGVSRDLMASPGVLKLLVYQTLLPRLCRHCALGTIQPDSELSCTEHYRLLQCLSGLNLPTQGLRWRNPAGCDACRTAASPRLWGWKGRVAVAEILAPGEDTELLACIRRRDAGAVAACRDARGRDDPERARLYWTVRETALDKVAQGLVDVRDVMARLGRQRILKPGGGRVG